MAKDRSPKITKNGLPDSRGHSPGSTATQFAKDDGRRRPGRPKKSRDLRTIVERVREMPVGTSSNGKRNRSVNTQEGILLAQRKKALNGDTRAALFMQNQIDRFEAPSVDPKETARLLERDKKILDWAKSRSILPTGDPTELDNPDGAKDQGGASG